MKPDRVGLPAGEVIGVIGTEGDCVEWVFPGEPGAVRTARSLVRDRLRGWDLDSVGDITALLVSELVTNALRHATGPIGVRLVLRPDGLDGVLLVEVSDPLPDPPRERAARPEDEGGRGLQLVASSARRWGTRPGGTGKTVWFELAVPE
ncbi:ATP-binding protein [Streptomyces flaveolus]|jgi:anti-sigma regulatory factor (Ser/Thr protein kinase)|uniref:ATP-binding protein n=1 Tax=Streptomyces flaveolus TaxID=67297 RepID=UPI0019A4433C|nr:ATP-binding protein [Streptomyces flaveolus]